MYSHVFSITWSGFCPRVILQVKIIDFIDSLHRLARVLGAEDRSPGTAVVRLLTNKCTSPDPAKQNKEIKSE